MYSSATWVAFLDCTTVDHTMTGLGNYTQFKIPGLLPADSIIQAGLSLSYKTASWKIGSWPFKGIKGFKTRNKLETDLLVTSCGQIYSLSKIQWHVKRPCSDRSNDLNHRTSRSTATVCRVLGSYLPSLGSYAGFRVQLVYLACYSSSVTRPLACRASDGAVWSCCCPLQFAHNLFSNSSLVFCKLFTQSAYTGGLSH